MTKYLNPKKYLEAALDYFGRMYFESRYDIEAVRLTERQKFAELGFRYEDALEKLDTMLRGLGQPNFASQHGMGSVHWILFCSLSYLGSIDNILEIGTYDGETTRLLSNIFPSGNITTVDLPDDDPIFGASYQRNDTEIRRAFKDRQTRNLSNPRIRFLQTNSFFLPGILTEKFDLIWIDGGHLYPEIAWDICNAYSFCSTSGWIMCDDVIPRQDGLRDAYVSPDSYHVLEYMSQRTRDRVTYFLKRESSEWSANPYRRKYVGVIQKSAGRDGRP
jgi:predicted O-methyltransferase YrrM